MIDHDLRTVHARGLLLQALAAEVTRRANEVTAAAYASAIWRNARLRARFRRRAPDPRWHDNGGYPPWLRRPRPCSYLREYWGAAFARGPLPDCYVCGRLLMIGRADTTPEQTKEIERQIERHGGDLPCCVCPATAVTACLTHWALYHASAARCFRCERHPAARPGVMPGVVCGPLWEGRRTTGYALRPSPEAAPLPTVMP